MTTTEEMEAAVEVREVIDRWVEAFRTSDVDAALAVHAPDIVSFDIVPPLRFQDRADYRTAWEAVFGGAFVGPITIELRDLSITVRDDIAFSHSLNRFIATRSDEEKVDYWFRWTACFQRVVGNWMIVHDHASLPTDFASGRSVQDLQP